MIELWPFQADIMEKLRVAIRAGYRRPLVVSPTGSGKTVMFAYLSRRLAEGGRRTNILTHRKELLSQTCKTLKKFDVRHGTIESGVKYYDPRIATHVSSAFTLANRLHLTQVMDYLMIDEGHHAVHGSTWNKIFDFYNKHNKTLVTIGWTATPQRLSGEGLGQTYDIMILGPTVTELIDGGYLSKYTMLAPPRSERADLSKVSRSMGDFTRKGAAGVMDKPKITGNAISHYRKYLNGAPSVAFCVSVVHAQNVAEQFKGAGFRAACVDGNMGSLERHRIMRDFGRGELNVVTSCDLISEGLDVPGMIGAILLRPTESLALYLQQVGRCLRSAPGKERAFILDHVGNSEDHGLPCDDREWTIEGTTGPRKKRDPDDIAIRQCGKCGSVNKLTAKECRDCGEAFKSVPRMIEEVEGELEEVDPRIVSMQFRKNRADAKDLSALADIGRMRGMPNPEGWAQHVINAREEKKKPPTEAQQITVARIIEYCKEYILDYQEFGSTLKIPEKQMAKIMKDHKPTEKQSEKINKYFDEMEEDNVRMQM